MVIPVFARSGTSAFRSVGSSGTIAVKVQNSPLLSKRSVATYLEKGPWLR